MVEGSYSPCPEWILMREQHEQALARRHVSKGMVLKEHVKELEPLKVGDVVSIQNQMGNHARK